MTYTLTNMTTLGTVRSENITKDAQLFQMPMPESDSIDTIVLDLFGVARTIKIEGIYVPTTNNEFGISGGTWATYTNDQKIRANIEMFIYQLDALVNGVQVSRTYHSDKSGGVYKTGNYKVIIMNENWKHSEGEVNKLDYSIDMQECAEVV